MGSSSSPQKIHIFMVSFPGQGHVNPLLRLGLRLASSGLFVTFSAPEAAGISIRKANSTAAAGDPTPCGSGMIQFEFFDDGWDLNHPNSDDLGLYLAHLEVVGREKLPKMIKNQEETGRPVSCLINNPFIPWVSDVAESLKIPSAVLWIQSCACFSAYYHYHNNLAHFSTETEQEIEVQLPYLPLFKHDEIPSFLHPTTPYPFLRKAILGQFGNLSKPFCILMDTFQEFERENIGYMSKICRPIKTVGPLFKEIQSSSENSNSNSSIRADFLAAEDCMEWLDAQPPRAVVYISFGSVVHLPQEQVNELAFGLEAAELPFLWVLRPPPKRTNWKPHVLPEGFVERVGERGKIVQWCPQVEVLGHRSTACFVTHCGWNSTMEVVASGVPVVALPQWGDQVTNAKFLVDVYKVAIRMSRGEAEGRIVPRDEVAACLREAVSGPRAEEMRENAVKWKKAAEEAVAEGGSSFKNMQDFVDDVVRISGR